MRVVVDTNVMISALFFGGIPNKILTAWRDGILSIVVTDDIIREYERVFIELHNKYKEIEIKPILEMIKNNTEHVSPQEIEESACADPEDIKFLSAALGGGLSIIISGDKHLLSVSGFQDLVIMKPKDFVVNFL